MQGEGLEAENDEGERNEPLKVRGANRGKENGPGEVVTGGRGPF